jgi:hypothetical protein
MSLTESDISNGGRIYPFMEGANSLEPDQDANMSGRSDMSAPTTTPLEPDSGPSMSHRSDIYDGGQICLTRADCHDSRTRPEVGYI